MGSGNLQTTGKVSALVPEYELMFLIWYDPPGISMWRWSNPVISCSLLICAICGLFVRFFFFIILTRNLINLTKSFVSVGLLFRMIYAYIKCDCKPFPNTSKSQL